jgi:hypothetical protein
MLLVDGLARHTEGFGHLGPCPTLAHRALDLSVLEAVGHRPEGRGRGEAVGGTAEGRRTSLRHMSNDSCLVECMSTNVAKPTNARPHERVRGTQDDG